MDIYYVLIGFLIVLGGGSYLIASKLGRRRRQTPKKPTS